MEIRPIRTDADHAQALEELNTIFDAEEGTEEFDRLDVLATLIEAYEIKRWPMPSVDPIDALKAAMEAGGHTQADLGKLIGQNRSSEILARKRPLTLTMIRAISAAWNVPADLLVEEYELVA